LYLLRAQVFIQAFIFGIVAVTALAYRRLPYRRIVLMVLGDVFLFATIAAQQIKELHLKPQKYDGIA
jgi:hypothetical protein